eukprot:15345974-Ditylum_brightwellii.AAC.1
MSYGVQRLHSMKSSRRQSVLQEMIAMTTTSIWGKTLQRTLKKTKAESVAMKVEEVIALGSDSGSSGLSVFMSRSKKVKQKEVKIKKKEEKVKIKKKGNTKNKKRWWLV